MTAGKVAPKVITAIARELIGFIWAIARMVEPRTARAMTPQGGRNGR
jgi:transposase